MKIDFIEIIESVSTDPNLLMWKFEDQDKEIKNGAQLTVRESQNVLFLNEGSMADVFVPGRHVLSTENLPILSKLRGWRYGFNSPYKADIYFFNTCQLINNKWGTATPIIMRDAQFGQVRVRAFGNFDMRIVDIIKFFREYAGTYPTLHLSELQAQLRDTIAPVFAQVLAKLKIPLLDVAENFSEIGMKIQPYLEEYFQNLGISLTHFNISSVTLPEEVSAHFDKITNMNMVTDMARYTAFNTANAMGQEHTSINQGLQAALMMSAMAKSGTQAEPQAQQNPMEKLRVLKDLLDAGLIDPTEFKAKKEAILNQI